MIHFKENFFLLNIFVSEENEKYSVRNYDKLNIFIENCIGIWEIETQHRPKNDNDNQIWKKNKFPRMCRITESFQLSTTDWFISILD